VPSPTGGLSDAPEARTRYGYPWIISDAKGETVVLLVCRDRTRGVADHIPNIVGQPLCKIRLNLSLWQIEARPVEEARICHRCTVVLAKQIRSLPFRPS
jgi:hypothetical protein